jgi:hypothetical protein
MLLVALSLAFAAMFMFAGPASAQTTCPSGFVLVDGVCVPTTNTIAVPVDTFGPSQEFSIRRASSGAANPTTRISNTGDNVNLSAPVQQIVNTGNVLNEQGVVTGPGTGTGCVDNFGFDCGFTTPFVDDGRVIFVDDGIGGPFFGDFDRVGDLDITGSTLTVGGDLNSTATQTIEQAAAAGR